jgi:molecular chaperone DnaK (HSP70)
MMESNKVFGIDLGTTQSCIGHIDDASGRPAVVPNAEGDLTTPSVVLFEGVERVVGKEAKNASVMYADRVVTMVKRQMGVAGWRFAYEDVDHTAEEISSYVLRKLAADTEAMLGVPVRDVVITCPAYFGIAEREATAKAGEIAGLNVLEVINEPTAAAISYGVHADGDQTVLVYDLGGGTFDVTLIEIKEGSVRVVATGGDHLLGGRDWDQAVVAFLAETWQRDTDSTEDPRDSEETLQDLWQRAEAGKHTLSARAEARVTVSHAGQRVPVTLGREKFDELTAHLLERTVEFTKAVLDTGREVGTSGFDKLLLVGGSTRMPQVAARLAAEFGVTPVVHDPDQSVAKGAAIYAQKLAIGERIDNEIVNIMGTHGTPVDRAEVPEEVYDQAVAKVATEEGMRKEVVAKIGMMTVTNVASKSFGVVAIDDCSGSVTEYISNLVLSQEAVPVTKTQTYATVRPNQPRVDIRVMENTQREKRVRIEDGRQIGLAVLTLTPGLPDEAPVDVTFELTPDGRLKITGRDLAETGAEIVAVVETDQGLSEEELRQAKERAQGVKISG